MRSKQIRFIHNLFSKFQAKENVALSQFSTLKVGGPARYLIIVNKIEEIAQIQLASYEYGLKLHILSGGSNTLFSDNGFDGIVLKLGPAFNFIAPDPNGRYLLAGAATSFAKITKMAISFGWPHALGWCGTPGLLGGAIRMNAGTKTGEIKDAIECVYGIKNGKIICYSKTDINFGYRKSDLPKDLIIYQAQLSCDSKQLESIQLLMKKAQEYRLKRKQTQPTINSLGSFFKNPNPSFAAQLIEKCNLKGLQYFGAQISPLHANFIVNNGGASAKNILYIASIAQKSVFDRFGVVLHPEVRLVGNFMPSNPLDPKNFERGQRHPKAIL
jgi:UDP-N-acetylmuramate dehydrogenase